MLSAPSKKILLALFLGVVSFGLMVTTFAYPQAFLVGFVVAMVTLWTNEGLPMAVVSLLPIILFPACGILSTQAVTANYANPIIYLFLGGFLIAIAVEKTGLHHTIAHSMLRRFPASARGMIFALVVTSGLLSSVLSNTTTTLLLLPIALFLSDHTTLKVRLALAIAYGASIGGILTPIGTPPNLILMGFLSSVGLPPLSFVQWIYMVFPLVVGMFVVVGLLLSVGVNHLPIEAAASSQKMTLAQKKVVGVIFTLVLVLLVNAPIRPYYAGLGMSEPLILLAAGLVLFVPPFGILDWMEDKGNIPYRIMFLFGAGFAIADGFTQTGIAAHIASSLGALSTMPTLLFVLIVATIVTFTTEITSNTALISIMLPILYKVAEHTGVDATLIMMVATVCASYAFMLPIATPPNAIAMSSGVVSVKTMARYGLVLNLAGIILIVATAQLFWQ
jgi:sodium-dependent dicarboxylate transporter 2/3/5